jgi:hypothetical protein
MDAYRLLYMADCWLCLVLHLCYQMSYWEFPTLKVLQEHARIISPESSMLYLHTKVTNIITLQCSLAVDKRTH